jgi:hypothetical protein
LAKVREESVSGSSWSLVESAMYAWAPSRVTSMPAGPVPAPSRIGSSASVAPTFTGTTRAPVESVT